MQTTSMCGPAEQAKFRRLHAVALEDTRPARWRIFAAVALAIMSASSVDAKKPAKEDSTAPTSADWPLIGGNTGNTRYSALAQINRRNLNRLSIAWVSEPFDDGVISRAPIVVKSGLLFVKEGRYVQAMSATSGERVWQYDTTSQLFGLIPSDDSQGGPGLGMGDSNDRALGASQELVYVGLEGGKVVALNAKTGAVVWTQQAGAGTSSKRQSASITLAYNRGVVFVGLADFDGNQRGSILALDAATGKEQWQTSSIPRLGEHGHETWRSMSDGRWLGGGGVSTDLAIDAQLGLVYFITGGAAPADVAYMSPGVKLYTNSVLAVDSTTGQLKWHYQLIRHNVLSGDPKAGVVLYDARVRGRSRKALGLMRADGYLFLLDRLTGKPLLEIEDRPVSQLTSQRTAKPQPFPVAGESLLMSCEDWRKEQVPNGFTVGCMFTPPASPPPSADPQNVLSPAPTAARSSMAYSQRTGYFYAQATSKLHWPRRSQDPYFKKEVGLIPGLQMYGELAAINSGTGKIVWRRRVPASDSPAELLVTAGGLVFRSSSDGHLEAFDALTGAVLWQYQADSAGGPLATYEADGEQYLAQATGSSVWAFKLGGRVRDTATPAALHQSRRMNDPPVESEEVETSALHVSRSPAGTRYFIDEFSFSPARALARAGKKILFVNNGSIYHEVVALDGSWATGRLSPADEAWITFGQPGQYLYTCKEHPWSYGELTILPAESKGHTDEEPPMSRTESRSSDFSDRSRRGKEYFKRSCSVCHGEDLAGRGAAPALLGDAFRARWSNASLGGLFDNIRSTMPLSSPGSLSRETYLDLVAYLLRSNDALMKQDKLNDEPAELGKITLQFVGRP